MLDNYFLRLPSLKFDFFIKAMDVKDVELRNKKSLKRDFYEINKTV